MSKFLCGSWLDVSLPAYEISKQLNQVQEMSEQS